MVQPRLRIAFWSTPRTISTACLRSFSERSDCIGLDEPLYAHWLTNSGREHPMRDEILATQSSEAFSVISDSLLGPCSATVQFVKHMCHHVADLLEHEFLHAPEMRHVFLIRDPREQLASLHEDLGSFPWQDLGYETQLQLFHQVSHPLVLDSRDLLSDPEAMLRLLCQELKLDFQDSMLAWPPGPHPCFGIWAPFWYGSVLKSTGFQANLSKERTLPATMQPFLDRALPLHEELRAVRLRV